jgi:hypothetical protein
MDSLEGSCKYYEQSKHCLTLRMEVFRCCEKWVRIDRYGERTQKTLIFIRTAVKTLHLAHVSFIKESARVGA